LKFQFRPLADVPSVVANRTNHPRRIPSDKGIRGNVLGDYRTRRDDRVLAYGYATDDGRARCEPHAFLNHDGLSDCGDASLRRFKGVARRDDAHVRPDHHIVGDVEAAQVIESAVLIYEDILPDADFVPTSCKKGGISKKLSSTVLPMSSLNKARISSTSLNVKRFSAAVIPIARLTFANMAADSGVLR
jgi:hypothetical protein